MDHIKSFTDKIVKIPYNISDLASAMDASNEQSKRTLYIFDSINSEGNPAIYQLPHAFEAPADIGMVGNRSDTLAEFVVDASSAGEHNPSGHYVLTASNAEGSYHFANVEFDSRNPLQPTPSSSATSTSTVALSPTPTPSPSPVHSPTGVLDFKGAKKVTMDNVRVVRDPASNDFSIQTIRLGCDEVSGNIQKSPVYDFRYSEFDLRAGQLSNISSLNAVFNIEGACNGGDDDFIQLTLQNTKTVILRGEPGQSTGVVFSASIWPRDSAFRMVDSTCNQVVDGNGNDISSDHMGKIRSSGVYMVDGWQVELATGAFGFKGRDDAWGFRPTNLDVMPSPTPGADIRYQSGFASMNYWEDKGFDLTCVCPSSTSVMMSPSEMPSLSSSEALLSSSFYTSSSLGYSSSSSSYIATSSAGIIETPTL